MISCRLCGDPLDTGYAFTLTPAPSGAQHFVGAADLARTRAITLTVVACGSCGLVQATTPPVDGHRRAITAAGVSAPMRAHRLDQARRLAARAQDHGGRLLLVGCGNGYELPILAEAGFRPEGVEWGGRSASAPDGYTIHDGYPQRGSALPGAPYGAFACFNFLEHAPDPRGFLSAIAMSLEPGGVGVVEVPNYAAQHAHGRVTDYIADHLSYFTDETLRAMLTLSGFVVESLAMVRDGENLEAIVTRRAAAALADESATLARTRAAVRLFFVENPGAVVWGASHQALTLLAGIDPAHAPTAILDSAAFKHGMFAPASAIPIVAPTPDALAGADAVLVVAAGYEREIVATLRTTLAFGGAVWAVRGAELARLD